MSNYNQLHDYQFGCFEWFLSHTDNVTSFNNKQLILPSNEFFSSTILYPKLKVADIFELVVTYAGLDKSLFEIEFAEGIPNVISQPSILNIESGPNINSQNSPSIDDITTIFYHPAHLSNPTNLIAHFSFELSLWLTSQISEEPPGGTQAINFVSDIGASFLGFGIFIANATHDLIVFSGADSGTGQRVSENRSIFIEEHSCSLAMFCLLKDINCEVVNNYCNKEFIYYFEKAYKILAKSSGINKLKEQIK